MKRLDPRSERLHDKWKLSLPAFNPSQLSIFILSAQHFTNTTLVRDPPHLTGDGGGGGVVGGGGGGGGGGVLLLLLLLMLPNNNTVNPLL